MKRAIVCFLLVLMSLNLFAEKLKISQDANMRTAPNKDSEVVKVLKGGTTCEGELSKENNDSLFTDNSADDKFFDDFFNDE